MKGFRLVMRRCESETSVDRCKQKVAIFLATAKEHCRFPLTGLGRMENLQACVANDPGFVLVSVPAGLSQAPRCLSGLLREYKMGVVQTDVETDGNDLAASRERPPPFVSEAKG